MSIYTCGNCHAQVARTTSMCPRCGVLLNAIECQSCGCVYSQDYSICPQCGSRGSQSPSSSPPKSEPIEKRTDSTGFIVEIHPGEYHCSCCDKNITSIMRDRAERSAVLMMASLGSGNAHSVFDDMVNIYGFSCPCGNELNPIERAPDEHSSASNHFENSKPHGLVGIAPKDRIKALLIFVFIIVFFLILFVAGLWSAFS